MSRTRAHSLRIQGRRFRTEMRRNLFTHRGLSLWNSPTQKVVETKTLNVSEGALDTALGAKGIKGYGGRFTFLANPPLTYTSPDTQGQFSTANSPNLHIWGLGEETGAAGGNPGRHGENLRTDSDPGLGLNPGPWEAAVPTTVPTPAHQTLPTQIQDTE